MQRLEFDQDESQLFSISALLSLEVSKDRGRSDDPPPFAAGLRAKPASPLAAIVEAARQIADAIGTGKRKRQAAYQATFEAVVDAVIANVVHRSLCHQAYWLIDEGCWCDETAGWITIPLSNRAFETPARYRPAALARTLPKIVGQLAEVGLIELRKSRPSASNHTPSTMRAAPALVWLIQQYPPTFDDFTRSPNEELIILKGVKPLGGFPGRGSTAPRIDYADTHETNRMRAQMRRLNAWLAAADIAIIERNDDGPHFDACDRMLRRLFNNTSFEYGGRLGGGFWSTSTMRPKPGRLWRGDIRIEEEAVVVVDFSSMFVRLLYAAAGEQAPEGDLYTGITGLDDPRYRDGIKLVISALMFRNGPLGKKPQGSSNLLPKRLKASAIDVAIRANHPKIAHLFGSVDCNGVPIGHRLFRRESDILIAVLEECQRQGIVALPLHDAIIVKASRIAEAKRIMLEMFEVMTGSAGVVGVKRPEDTASEQQAEDEAAFDLDDISEEDWI